MLSNFLFLQIYNYNESPKILGMMDLSKVKLIFLAIMSYFKAPLSCLRQFLATESPLKMMKNTFYFTSKALFVLKIFKFLS